MVRPPSPPGSPPMLELYVPGKAASGTVADLEAMRAVAFSCWVFRMRRLGTRLPAHQIDEPIQGELLPIDRYGEQDRFYVRLCRPGQFTDWSHELHGARLVRAAAGCMTLTGDEWVDSARAHQRQTWLCVPTPERGWQILQAMAS